MRFASFLAMRRLSFFSAPLLLLACAGCSQHIYSPPARMVPLETAAAIGEGELGVQLEGGVGSVILGSSYIQGSARLRYGLMEELDLSIEANVFSFLLDYAPPDETPHLGLYSGRIGTKYAPSPHFAITGGLGAGGSAAGGFVSPDVGLIVAYENPYFVPFLSSRVSLSVPISPQEVLLQDGNGPFPASPVLSFGWGVTTGVRVPLMRTGPLRVALLAGVDMTFLWDSEQSDGMFSAQLGVEIFGASEPDEPL